MVAFGPGFQGSKTVDELVSLIDVAPTILAAGGTEPPPYMRGRPLQQLVEGKAEDWPQEVFLQISEDHVGRAIRTKKWKYSVRAFGKDGCSAAGSAYYAEDVLYDLEKDPHERHNRVRDAHLESTRAELEVILKRRMVQAGEAASVIEKAKEYC